MWDVYVRFFSDSQYSSNKSPLVTESGVNSWIQYSLLSVCKVLFACSFVYFCFVFCTCLPVFFIYTFFSSWTFDTFSVERAGHMPVVCLINGVTARGVQK